MECADGNSVPYKGYIEAKLEVIGIPKSKKKTCLFLVATETGFNKKIQVLFGTNVLSELLEWMNERWKMGLDFFKGQSWLLLGTQLFGV